MLQMVLLGPRRARPPICIVKPMVLGGYFQMLNRKKEEITKNQDLVGIL